MTEQQQDTQIAPDGQSDSTNRLSPSRIVCAAIRAYDGALLIGIRHYSPDMASQINETNMYKFRFLSGDDQGFVDQHGKYFTRKEAYVIARDAGQIIRPDACIGEELCSEGLY